MVLIMTRGPDGAWFGVMPLGSATNIEARRQQIGQLCILTGLLLAQTLPSLRRLGVIWSETWCRRRLPARCAKHTPRRCFPHSL